MKVIIKNENGNEEILDDNIIVSNILIIVVIFFALASIIPFVLWLVLFWVIIALWGYLKLFIWDEMIIFDKGIKSVIVEKRTFDHKWKEDKTIRFSDIEEINIIEEMYFEGATNIIQS